jgi:hypothetical protein
LYALLTEKQSHAVAVELPGGSRGAKTSIKQSIQRRSSRKRHVVSAEKRVFGQRGCDCSDDAFECVQIFARHLIAQNPQCGTPKCEYLPKRTSASTIAAAKSDVSTARERISF